jgi:hypothetical protein
MRLGTHNAVFDTVFHSNILLQLLSVVATLFHLGKKYDSCCTAGEEMELSEQNLPAGNPLVYNNNALVFLLQRI